MVKNQIKPDKGGSSSGEHECLKSLPAVCVLSDLCFNGFIYSWGLIIWLCTVSGWTREVDFHQFVAEVNVREGKTKQDGGPRTVYLQQIFTSIWWHNMIQLWTSACSTNSIFCWFSFQMRYIFTFSCRFSLNSNLNVILFNECTIKSVHHFT